MNDDFRSLPPLRRLFDLARSRIRPEDLPDHVMGDPGTPDYIEAYSQVLRGGLETLEDAYDGGRLCDSFDIGENLLCFHADAHRSSTCRYFSILASCIQLYAWNGLEGPRGVQAGTIVAYLLDDAWSLKSEHGLEEIWTQCPKLFRALQVSANLHLRAVAILGEIVSIENKERHIALCHTLLSLQSCFKDPYVEENDEWVPNYWYLKNPIWGPLIDSRKRWGQVLEAHFPRVPEVARVTRELFLG